MHIEIPQLKEELTLPWIQEALKEYPFEIMEMEWVCGEVGGGVGVLSSLDRVKLTVFEDEEVRSLSLIVKTPPPTMEIRNFALSEGFCQREYKMYTKLFPKWRKFQDARSVPIKYRFRHPHCYYSAEQGEGVNYKMILLLEDMEQSGFKSWTPGFRQGLRLAQAKQVIKEMAIFHAVGIAFKHQVGLPQYDYDFLHKQSFDQPHLKYFFSKGVEDTCELLREDEDIPSGLIEELEAFPFERLEDVVTPDYSRICTITHQDFHVNNVMFSRQRGVMLDFQVCSNSNPMQDLSFFLFVNCEASLFTTGLSQVISYYHDQFHKAMKRMGSNVKFSLEQMYEDYCSSLLHSTMHIIMGSSNWSFGPNTSTDTKRRFKLALIQAYQVGGGTLGIGKQFREVVQMEE